MIVYSLFRNVRKINDYADTLSFREKLKLPLLDYKMQFFIQSLIIDYSGFRRFMDIYPERGTEVIQGKDVPKMMVQKMSATVSTHISTLLKNLMDFEWTTLNQERLTVSSISM